MQTLELKASARAEGKSGARKTRKEAMIPAVLYGKDQKPKMLKVNGKEFEKVVSTHAGINVLLKVMMDDGLNVVARVREYQAHPISRNFTHIDFQVVDLTKKISVEVPIHLEGKAKGVKEGGVLVVDRRSLIVRCLPTAIPESITVDISELMIGNSVHVNELKLPEGVECSHEINFGIVSVVAPMKEEVAAPTAEAVPAEGAVPAAAGATTPGAAGGTAAPGTAGGTASTAGAKPAGGASAKEKK